MSSVVLKNSVKDLTFFKHKTYSDFCNNWNSSSGSLLGSWFRFLSTLPCHTILSWCDIHMVFVLVLVFFSCLCIYLNCICIYSGTILAKV